MKHLLPILLIGCAVELEPKVCTSTQVQGDDGLCYERSNNPNGDPWLPDTGLVDTDVRPVDDNWVDTWSWDSNATGLWDSNATGLWDTRESLVWATADSGWDTFDTGIVWATGESLVWDTIDTGWDTDDTSILWLTADTGLVIETGWDTNDTGLIWATGATGWATGDTVWWTGDTGVSP